MIVAGMIAALSMCLMLYKLLPLPCVIIIAVLAFGVGLIRSRHHHGGFLSIDLYAQRSPLRHVNPGLKTAYALAAIVISVAGRSYLICILVCVVSFVYTVALGKVPARQYCRMLMLPVGFISLSSIALTLQLSSVQSGYVDIPLGNVFLSVTRASQLQAIGISLSAYAGVSSLYMLGLTTPLPGIIKTLNDMHLPGIIIELMYLIYRYIFVLFSIQDTMSTAASSRLGYRGYRRSVKTIMLIASNLLSLSFMQASRNFDAMEARCYDGTLRFYEQVSGLKPRHVLGFGSITAVLVVLWILGV